MDLSNNNNLPLDAPGQDGALTLLEFSQFDIPELRVQGATKKESGIPMLQGTIVNQKVQEIQVAAAAAKTDKPSNKTQNAIKRLVNHGSTFNNCTFVFNNKVSDSTTTHYNKLTCILTIHIHLYK